MVGGLGGRLFVAAGIGLPLAFFGASAEAAPKKGQPAAAATTAEPALPAPHVTLRLTPGTAGAPWRIQIFNGSAGPVRIPADPRLLSLDVSPPAAADPSTKKGAPKTPPPARCTLPDDARPLADAGPDLVIPAGRAWSISFDPLFYCFGAKERGAAVVGASVKARFGWPSARAGGHAPSGPFAVNPVGASVDKVSAVRELESDPVTLADAITPPKGPPGDKAEADDDKGVSLVVPETLDASRGVELNTTVAVRNNGDTPITLLLRPELLTFRVVGPNGPVSCGIARQIGSPIRELFSTVTAHARAETTVLFSATCPAGTFNDAGIYRVEPTLDTTGASGAPIHLKTWDGVAHARSPLVVRIRTSRALPTAKPVLD